MWVLVEVEDAHDVGVNETRRLVLSDNASIVKNPDLPHVWAVVALGEEIERAMP